MASYVFQPRGKRGYAFRIAVPKELYGRFLSSTGKPLHRIIEGLGTDGIKEAEWFAAKRRAHWLTIFERARQDVPLTLAEIDDVARQFYRETLARLAANAQRGLPEALQGYKDTNDVVSTLSALKGLGDFDTLLNSIAENFWNNLGLEFDPTTPAPSWRTAENVIAQINDFESVGVAHEIAIIQRQRGVSIDPASETYRLLGQALIRARLAAVEGRLRAMRGQETEEPATFLGTAGIDPVTLKLASLPRLPVRGRSQRNPWELFAQWISEVKPASSTVNRWRTVFLNLQDKFGTSEIIEDEAREWARSLVTSKRSPSTVSEIWLSAARTIYGWATEQKLANDNPFAKVKITVPNKPVVREKRFTLEEVEKILRAARAIEPGRNPFKAAQRWATWLLAYSGARAGEICQLRGQDIQEVDGIWIMKLTPEAGTTKTKAFRDVPLHTHLIEQGFLDFVAARGNGPLFYNPEGAGNGSDATNPTRPRAVKTRERLAAWIRSLGVTDKAVSPTHGFRHLFKSIAASKRANISDSMSDAITGHAPATVAGRYVHVEIADMAEALSRFPRYLS